jgi:serine/threonine protein kinase/WD40 repeat protein
MASTEKDRTKQLMRETKQSSEQVLFEAALLKPNAAERGAFLDGACRDNPALRKRLDLLLEGHFAAAGFLTKDADRATLVTERIAPSEPDTIDRYRILEKLGEGGCGVVYVAEQTAPVRRRVALKVIKLGMDTKAVVARFEAERQALAMMDHPNIAKVLDAGTTEGGRPYFVMELVRGIRITDYCDQNNLSTTDRLDLFIKICHAIQHAHQKGIIHRDIKPSNILVTLHDGVPVPKVIDFGIAKATEGRLTDATVYTQLHQFIGTPAYMSPEQAEMSGLDIDTRSDIYSLGVLLYELLTGLPPFDGGELIACGLDEMRRTIREKEPARPSTRLATLQPDALTTTAKRRSVDSIKLLSQLRGDLDWIVMKCLEKDRTRRYETANGVAADLKRHLTNEPVVARPPSTAYRIRKAVRRNGLVFTSAAAVLLAIIAGLALSSTMLIRERVARKEANLARQKEAEQRLAAERNERAALVAEHTAEGQRSIAVQATSDLRKHIYVAQMSVAHEALREGNFGRAQQLLENQRPQRGEADLRGFEWRYLWQQARGDEREQLAPYSGFLGALAISPDGQLLAFNRDNPPGLAVVHLPSKTMVKTFDGKQSEPLQFSPDGRILIGHSKKGLLAWKTADWEALPSLPVNFPVLFLPDGESFLAQEENRFSLWNIETWKRSAELGGAKPLSTSARWASPRAAAVTADGRQFYYLGERWRIDGWDLKEGRALPSIELDRESLITCLAMSSDHRLALSCWDGTVRVIDLEKRAWVAQFAEHLSWISGLKFFADDQRLISTSADQTIVIYDPDRGRVTRRLRGHNTEIWALDLSQDGKTLVTGAGYGGPIFRWALDASSSTSARDSALVVRPLSDGRLLRFRPGALDYERYDLITGRSEPAGMEHLGQHVRRPLSPSDSAVVVDWISISPDARWAITAGPEKSIVTVLNSFTGQKERTLSNNVGKVLRAVFAEDCGSVALSGQDSEVRLVNTSNWSSHALCAPLRGLSAAYFSSDSRQVAIVSQNNGVMLRKLSHSPSSNIIIRLPTSDFSWSSAAFSPDAQYFAIGGQDNLIYVFDLKTRRALPPLAGHAAGVWGLAFSPDNRTLASAGDKRIKLWSVDTWQEIFTLASAERNPFSLSFSPDGRYLVSHSPFRVWEAPGFAQTDAPSIYPRN